MNPYYQDDWVTLYHARWEDVPTELLAPAAVLVTDPPYGIGADSMTLGSRPKWRRVDRGDRRWDDKPPEIAGLLAMERPTIIWGGNYFRLPLSKSWLVWDKQNGDTDYADCELAWTNLNKPVRRIVHRWMGASAHEPEDGRRLHPTQKPVAVMRWCLTLCPPGLVLDPFAGSGTTLVAAKSVGRRSIGVEVEERYCEVAANRLRQSTLGLVA